ncbi:BgTH12-05762 [Blumeria graminis f. sp. triticale]|uniref:BgTH12-05762 n=1 Tax=Blumeria graminis f. sp. triticale TaxID=1689686 RepID=A0A9W4GFW4_BLUGR|nr:BgTH12-05762 [Blumeria graminis f. sp. triticale]
MSLPILDFLKFTTHKSLAYRLVLSTLTGRPIHVSQIRATSTNPGLAPNEVSLLRLLDSITNGTSIQISYTGTTLTYIPGLITGGLPTGSSDVVKCVLPDTCRRGVSWFLLPICILAPFAQAPLNIRFEGDGVITSATEEGDISVDTMRTAILPLYDAFGIPLSRLELRILQRSSAMRGGAGGHGIVELRFAGQIRLPKTLHLYNSPGRVRRIRGVAYCTGVSASGNARMIHSARKVLNPLLFDINIAAQYDQAPQPKKNQTTKRQGIGFGLSLIAETVNSSVIYSADVSAPSEGGITPEDIGKKCALQLLEVISQGGCVTRIGAVTVLILMNMGSEDVGRLRLGREIAGSEEVITLGRDLRKFGASSWGLRDVEDDESGDLIFSVRGLGIGNVGRKIA